MVKVIACWQAGCECITEHSVTQAFTVTLHAWVDADIYMQFIYLVAC